MLPGAWCRSRQWNLFYDIKKDSLYIPGHAKGKDPFQVLAGEKYNCMLNDSRGLLWMGTQYGIKVLSPDRKIDVLGGRTWGLKI